MRQLACDIPGREGQSVELCGWVHRIRNLGGITFVLLRDRSGMVQLVYDEEPSFGQEAVLRVRGTVGASEKAPGGYEIRAESTEVLGAPQAELPLPVNKELDQVGLEAILDHRIVSLRNPRIRRIFEVQSDLLASFSEALRKRGFTEIKSSKLIGSGTEGGTGLFPVDYFGETLCLAQSPQFYKQAMVASGLERVFEIGAAYRAEKHDTARHLNEYVSLDVEMAFIDSDSDLMDLETEILGEMFQSLEERQGKTLEDYGARVPRAEEFQETPRVTYDEARQILKDRTGKSVFEITPEGERELCLWALDEKGVEAVFVTAFPRKKRPFYTSPEGMKTRSFDLLFRGLEITTGGQRIHQYQELLEALPRFGLTEEGLGDYCSVFRYGCPPHGGFAIGLERLTQKILGLQNVKEASLFPRDRKRFRP
ncbi:aspartate--tRNA(Asp/Asn) ligase [Alkalispirochaeta sphaeroplastigenens]|uniref:Aspartate--tRNA(Asp/Asn) ligase n=1 Tax=Alkalispirochaeta sphaeroplastigenens TaxID=1187066 RepID=A0A2S4K0R3_9SPIO|nr:MULTISPECIES: aspartate--tRNA(Asn) ligase [Alkalispirochaeta]POR05346.1 aspartate--tRNA(Asp/Asn) ligase [Alkalispirochaeta sphaeroplastigenens]